MIFTDYYKFEKLTAAKSRYDVTDSTGEYDLFESILINKRVFNIGGLSLNYTPQPDGHKGQKVDAILGKGAHSITKVLRPNPESNISYGDINTTQDACIIIFNSDFRDAGVILIEVLIARGAKNDKLQIYHLFVDGELNHELYALRSMAVTKNVTGAKEEPGGIITPLSLC